MERSDFRRAVTDLWRAAARVGVLPVTGTSMEPLLRAGTEVVVRYETPARVALGDLVVFERDGRSVVHRVIAIQERTGRKRLLERGDNSPIGTWIDLAQVVAVVLGRPGPAGAIPLESPAVGRRRARYSRVTLALVGMCGRVVRATTGEATPTWVGRASRALRTALGAARGRL